jgi:hypothetical protein
VAGEEQLAPWVAEAGLEAQEAPVVQEVQEEELE